MKRSMKEQKSLRSCPSPEMKEEFPYGLKITLEKQELKKLGIKLDDFDMDEIISFEINTKITSKNKPIDTNTYEGSSESLSLQITHMYKSKK